MFFRLCRLYELGIRPVFVFDGPGRPSCKRDRVIDTAPMETEFRKALLKLIELFGFFAWHAYGEAEAECAMLQRLGFVDLVMTGDVDAFLFGARRVVRQWPAKREELLPCYDLAWIADSVGLDRSDLLLIALLRGSDYDTRGTHGIGITLAQALARCRHHTEFMNAIQQRDWEKVDVAKLRDVLTYELQQKCSGHARKSYGNTELHPGFPDLEILNSFIHPVTHIQQKEYVKDARQLNSWLEDDYKSPDWRNLAVFCREVFHWSPSYLTRRFRNLLYAGYMNERLRAKALDPEFATLSEPLPARKKNASKKNAIPSMQRQSSVNDFFSVTKRKTEDEDDLDALNNDSSHLPFGSSGAVKKSTSRTESTSTSSDILCIVNDKMVGSRKMYCVRFSPETLTEFTNMLKEGMESSTTFVSILGPDNDNPEDGEQDDEDDVTEEDANPQKLCQKWLPAILVENAYPRMAFTYEDTVKKKQEEQTRKRKNVGKGQKTLDSYFAGSQRKKTKVSP